MSEKDNQHACGGISEKKLDTIENPHNNHTIGDQGGPWTNYSLEKLSGCNVLIRF